MDMEVAIHYGLELEALASLERALLDDYVPGAWGMRRYSRISDVQERAVASDLLISLADGVGTALLDEAIASRRYAEILGPNGRTMPGPDTTMDERVEMAHAEAAITDCFRAMGTALDCLAGLCVLITGAPVSVQRAEGAWLLRDPLPVPKGETEPLGWQRVASVVRTEADLPETGWLAWALEMRNALVHRGALLRTWLNRPSRSSGQQFFVHTRTPVQYLMRMEQHLRRQPWLPDMHALRGGNAIADLWLAEPAQITLSQLSLRVTELSMAVCAELLDVWNAAVDRGHWPTAWWQLQARTSDPRTANADTFRGFDPAYQAPPPAALRLHPDSAKRAELAQRLRDEAAPADNDARQ